MGLRLGDLAGILTTSAPMLFSASFALALFGLGHCPVEITIFPFPLQQPNQEVHCAEFP